MPKLRHKDIKLSGQRLSLNLRAGIYSSSLYDYFLFCSVSDLVSFILKKHFFVPKYRRALLVFESSWWLAQAIEPNFDLPERGESHFWAYICQLAMLAPRPSTRILLPASYVLNSHGYSRVSELSALEYGLEFTVQYNLFASQRAVRNNREKRQRCPHTQPVQSKPGSVSDISWGEIWVL